MAFGKNLTEFIENFYECKMLIVEGKFRGTDYRLQLDEKVANIQKLMFVTCDFGGYSGLENAVQSARQNPDINILALTDYDTDMLIPHNLSVVRCHLTEGDPRFLGKILKICPELILDKYQTLIWFDANIILKRNIHEKITNFASADVILFNHQKRKNIFEEADAVVSGGKEDSAIIDRFFGSLPDQALNYSLYQGRFFIRHSSSAVKLMNDQWFEFVTNFSIRDQLSLPVALKNSHCNFIVHEAKRLKDLIEIKPHHKFDVSRYNTSMIGRLRAYRSRILYWLLVQRRNPNARK